MLSAQQVADKWVGAMAGAGTAYSAGIDSVTENPMEKAANAGAAYLAGVQQAEANGKRAAGLMRVTFQAWRDAAKQKGAARLATGATQAKSKFLNFMSQFLPFLQSARSEVKQMQRGTFEQNMARSYAMAAKLHEFKRS